MAKDRESASSSAARDVPTLLTDVSKRTSTNSSGTTPKAKIASVTPKAKAGASGAASMRKTAAAKRRNIRKGLALPTIDEEGNGEPDDSDLQAPPQVRKRGSLRKTQNTPAASPLMASNSVGNRRGR